MNSPYVRDIHESRESGPPRRMGGQEGEQASSGETGAEPRARLQSAFQALHTGPPAGAWPYAPSISFIGTDYVPGNGLMVYASAENLAGMYRTPAPERFTSGRAWDRYRAAYEEQGRNSGGFFPIVGMAPVEKGARLAAALFLAQRLGLPTAATPRAFLETLAAFFDWYPWGHAQSENAYTEEVREGMTPQGKTRETG